MFIRTMSLCVVCSMLGAAGAFVAISFTTDSSSDGQRLSAQQETEPSKNRQLIGKTHLVAATSVLLDSQRETVPPPLPTLASERFTPQEQINIRVYEAVNRGVVNITTKSARGENFFFRTAPSEGSGSGSVIDRKGHILTNFHVIDGARQVHVTLYDGQEYPAKLVGRDASTDIAVLKIDAPSESLFPVILGDSSDLRVGQRVFAIGNPFGLERTLTTGVISSLNRSISSRNRRKIKSIIQIDAAINPGNSGGPLLGSDARLIGMNTAIASKTGQSAGIGFAIPVGTIARIVSQLIENGRVVRADIGITRVLESDYGLLVVAVSKGGPAERAGIQGFRLVSMRRQRGGFIEETVRVDRSAADLITAVDGHKVVSVEQFLTLIEAKKPGDQARISLIRKKKPVVVTVTLSSDES